MKQRHRTITALFQVANLLLAALLFFGCAPGQLLGPTFTPTPTLTLTATLTLTPTSTATNTPSITPSPTLTIAETIGHILDTACHGEPTTSSNVGTSTDLKGVRLCTDYFNLSLPDNWLATTPETLRYVVAVGTANVQSGLCQYSSNTGSSYTIQRFKHVNTIYIFDSVTGAPIHQREVHGSVPICAETIFGEPKDTYGSEPSEKEMQAAMMALLSPLLPFPRFIPTATPIPVPLCSEAVTLSRNEDLMDGIYFSPDGTLLVTPTFLGREYWDVASGRKVLSADYALGYYLSPDSKNLILLKEDRTVEVWDMTSGSLIRSLEITEGGEVEHLVLLPDGTLVTFGIFAIKFWDLESGNELRTTELKDFYERGALSPNGQIIALEERGNGSNTYILRLWDTASGKEMSTLLESDHELGFGFSPEGRWLFAKTFDNTIHIWDVASGSELRTLENVDDMAFSPNETLLAVVSWSDEKVKLLDMTTESDVHTFDMSNVSKIVFSQDGTLLASVSAEQVKFWDVASGSEVRTLNIGYQDGLLFSPEGTLMVSDVQNDEGNQFMKVWDVANGGPMCDLKSNDTITEFVFSPDGKLLATATRDGIVTLWDISRP